MKISVLREWVDTLADSKSFKFALSLRDKLVKLGMPQARAQRLVAYITLDSIEEKFVDEVARLLYKSSVIIIRELGEEAFFVMAEKTPLIESE